MKFMEFEQFCRKNDLSIFGMSDLKILLSKYSPEYLRLKLSRWKQKGYLKSPKRGLYILGEAKPDEFEIASKLITPSYISLETALSHHSIIPDISMEVCSITTKNTRTFKTPENTFHFYHIKQELFCDFLHLRDEIFIATPEKAILDFFYFRKPDKDHVFFERLNRETIKTLRLKDMSRLVKKFPPYTQKILNHFHNVISR